MILLIYLLILVYEKLSAHLGSLCTFLLSKFCFESTYFVESLLGKSGGYMFRLPEWRREDLLNNLVVGFYRKIMFF